jgi:hypothetical protein
MTIHDSTPISYNYHFITPPSDTEVIAINMLKCNNLPPEIARHHFQICKILSLRGSYLTNWFHRQQTGTISGTQAEQ